MPPNTLMKTAFTLGSDERSRNAFSICSCEAPPPTSRTLAGAPQAEGQAPRREIAEAERGMRPLAQDLLGRPRGDLLDLHTTGLGRHHDVRAPAAIEGDREVELAIDGRRLLDEDRADPDALGRRLGRLEHHAEDLTGGVLGLGRIVRELDAAGLAAPAGVDLGLDDDLAAEPLSDLARSSR